MPNAMDVLRDAQALAEFSNLDPADVGYFRNNYPDFVPQKWWDYTPTTTDSSGNIVPRRQKQWELNQSYLRYSWQNNFKGGLSFNFRLTNSVFDPEKTWAFWWGEEEKPDSVNESEMGWGLFPHQKAVLFLFENPWRARFCAECNKRFVAAQPKNKFCSPECSQKTRNKQKLASWNKTGSKPRAQRTAKAKQQKSRRSRIA